MEPYDPSLAFKMRLPFKAQEELIVGRLYLRYNVKVQHEFIATSGLAGKQFLAAQGLKGIGPITSTSLLTPIEYSVSCAYHLMTVAGHEGTKFYPISPSNVRIGNVTRGDFGIHRDLNVPGTIGCIGIFDIKQWLLFTQHMARRLEQGHMSLPLRVIYY